jgi:hypothetical protein
MSNALTMKDLASRLSVLEDERDILRTFQQYAHSIDYGREQAWVDCFTDDGVFEVRARNGEIMARFSGCEELMGNATSHTRPPTAYHKHTFTVPQIKVDGDAAEVDSYFVRLDAPDDATDPYVMCMGRYRDKLVRCSDGKWRFRVRLAEIQNHMR